MRRQARRRRPGRRKRAGSFLPDRTRISSNLNAATILACVLVIWIAFSWATSSGPEDGPVTAELSEPNRLRLGIPVVGGDPSSPQERARSDPARVVADGSEGYLVISSADRRDIGLTVVPVSPNVDDVYRAYGGIILRDWDDLALLVRQGRILQVEDGTRCRLIFRSAAADFVEILEGPHAGKSVYTSHFSAPRD